MTLENITQHHLHSSSVAPAEYTDWQKVLITILLTLLSLFIIFGNAATIFIYKTTRCLQRPKNYFILSLAFADFMVGLVSVNLFTAYLAAGYWPFGKVVCYLWLIIDHWAVDISNYTLVAISMDRFMSVCFPMKHRWLYVKCGYVQTVLVVIWTLALVVWSPAMFMYTETHDRKCYMAVHERNVPITLISISFGYYIPVVLLSTAYFFISYKTTRRCHEMYIVYPKPGEQKEVPNKRPDSCFVTNSTRSRHIKANRRGVEFLLFVALVFILFWMPYSVLITVLSVNSNVHTSAHVWNICYLAGWVSSALNPVCYVLGNGQFRECFLTKVKKFKKKAVFRKCRERTKGSKQIYQNHLHTRQEQYMTSTQNSYNTSPVRQHQHETTQQQQAEPVKQDDSLFPTVTTSLDNNGCLHPPTSHVAYSRFLITRWRLGNP